MIEVQRDDEDRDNNAGYAWLHVEGVEMFPSLEVVRSGRAAELSPPPMSSARYTPRNAPTALRGRDFPEFVACRCGPSCGRSRPAFIGFGLFANGWIMARWGGAKTVRRAAIAGWIPAGPAILIILYGVQGSRTLPVVPGSVWGGLLLTILLTFVGITASFPLGVALALGRRSDLPVIKWTCTLFIEVIRGVPLITILFMAKLIVPFFWSGLSNIDLTVRMMIGLTLFSAAYLAENVRGGLQIVPHGQIEAARALGMNRS